MSVRTPLRRSSRAQAARRRAARSSLISGLARAGFVARGILYALIGVIALEIAFDHSRQQADRSGAVRLVAAAPFGSVLLWLLVVGFAGMALWHLSEALWGAAVAGGGKASSRAASAGRAVLYGAICYGILKFALGLGAPASTDRQSQDLTATALRYPGGQIVVAVVGLLIALAGIALMYQAWQARFLRNMRWHSASRAVRNAVTRLGQIGGIARGAVFVTIGIFLTIAAIDAQPRQAKGIDSALRSLAHTPPGPWLLASVALGLVTFGAFSICEARWRAV
jgi:hypothetical protein